MLLSHKLDINECEDPNLIKHKLCGRKKCVNHRGGYSCVDQSKIIKWMMIGNIYIYTANTIVRTLK